MTVKISFWFKKPNTDQGNLECITITNPKKVLEGKLVGFYECEVHWPETERMQHPFFSDNPIETLRIASECTKMYLQSLIFRGYTISEAESKEPWKLEKKDPQIYLQEKISEIKDNKDISQEGKQKIFGILKDTFGKLPHMKDQINKAIEN